MKTAVFLDAGIATDRVHDNIRKLLEDVARGELLLIDAPPPPHRD